MNDLRPLRAYHDAQPDPEPSSVAEMRARLTSHTRAPAARRRFRPAWGLALAGTAAAVTLTVALVAVPGDGHGGGGGPTRVDSAQTVLLAAAERAETAPTGRYWLVKTAHGTTDPTVSAVWITLDGNRWTAYRNPSPEPGTHASELHRLKGLAPMPVTVLGPGPALKALLKLPTDPKALRALAERNAAGYPVQALVSLLIEQPATPATRAAAFRALASMPGVRSLGRTADPRGRKGAGLLFRYTTPRGVNEVRLIVDPTTSQVLSQQTTGVKGKRGDSTTLYLYTGWTNEKPRVP